MGPYTIIKLIKLLKGSCENSIINNNHNHNSKNALGTQVTLVHMLRGLISSGGHSERMKQMLPVFVTERKHYFFANRDIFVNGDIQLKRKK